jgi:hypothetical protein
MIDREFYLPASWTGNLDRLVEIGVLNEVALVTMLAPATGVIAGAAALGRGEGQRVSEWASIDHADQSHPDADQHDVIDTQRRSY